jgi:hypothetical protein
MKKLFGGINLTWPKVIIMAILAGVYTAVMAMMPWTVNTSFIDITVTFEVWILFGIFIIMNSKSNVDSMLKCFVFFLISQPLVYLIQILFGSAGWDLFKYYKYWFIWTILTLPMGFIGYYLKKDKWWTFIILVPMLVLTAYSAYGYGTKALYWMPYHLLSALFCLAALLIYPGVIENKKSKCVAYVISLLIICGVGFLLFQKPFEYKTTIGVSDSEEFGSFDDNYKVSLEDNKYGDVWIEYDQGLEAYLINVTFKHGGKTKFILEDPEGNKRTFDLDIRYTAFDIEEIKE